MPKDVFETLNKKRRDSDLPSFATPRNAAAGSLRQLDAGVTEKRQLGIFFYGAVDPAELGCKTHWQLLHQLTQWGFPVHDRRRKCNNIEEAIDFYRSVKNQRDRLNLDIDGVVIKINRLKYQQKLGTGRTNPNWAIAYKFPPQTATTVLESINFQVGRTGTLTPVARLEPVSIGNVKVSRANLHNLRSIRQKDLRIGDTVFVERAGDVIPEVVRPVLSLRDGSEQSYQPPDTCPSCGSELKHSEDNLVCPSQECPAQLIQRLTHFASRRAANIHGLGARTAERLVEEQLVTSLADIYILTEKDLLPLPGFGQKSTKNLLQAINDSRKTPLERIVYGLGIPGTGAHRAANLAKKMDSIEDLTNISQQELRSIDGIGQNTATQIVTFLTQPCAKRLIRDLQKAGVGTRQ